MKKILAIIPTYYPSMGGAERSFYELYSGLSKKNFEIDILTPNIENIEKYETTKNLKIIRVGKKTKGRLKKFILYQIYEYFELKKLLKQNKYDLIHVHYAAPSCLIIKWLKRKLNIPIILTEHHYGTGGVTNPKENPKIVNIIIKNIYKEVTKVYVTGNTQLKFVRDLTGRKDIKKISLGTDLKDFNPNKYNKDIKSKYKNKRIILNVSRLDKRKNISDFIKSAKIVLSKFPETYFLIIGKGKEKEKLKKLIENLNLEKNVLLLGYVPDKELLEYYATADIFALTSKYEGFGIVYCEALASGTPVVSYDMTASREILEDSGAGIITNQNYMDFSKGLIRLLGDESILKEYSENARTYVKQKFSWNKMVNEYEKEYKQLIN
jgi:glycosyltransferase involved in cell wall biosynthesis